MAHSIKVIPTHKDCSAILDVLWGVNLMLRHQFSTRLAFTTGNILSHGSVRYDIAKHSEIFKKVHDGDKVSAECLAQAITWGISFMEDMQVAGMEAQIPMASFKLALEQLKQLQE